MTSWTTPNTYVAGNVLTAAQLNQDVRDNPTNLRERIGGANGLTNTANAKNTAGITLNNGAADDEALSLKNSDVAHGMTDLTETDTYGVLFKSQATSGGLQIRGFDDGGGSANGALDLRGYLGQAADTTHSAAGFGVIRMLALIKSGTSATSVGANGNLLTVENAGNTRFIVDAEGDTFQDGTAGTAYDDYDDVALLDAFDASLPGKGTVDVIFHEFLNENRQRLVDLGILHPNDGPGEDGRPFWSPSKMVRLLVGAVRQEYRRSMALEARLERLEKLLPSG